MSSPRIVVIPGAKSPEQVADNARAADWRLDYRDWSLIDDATRNLYIEYSA